jgi:hypothetical protein
MAVYSGARFMVEPFPPLRWTGALWEGRVDLPVWRGFSAGQGTEDTVFLRVAPPPGGGEYREPSPPQAAALRYLLSHDAAIRDNIVRAIYVNYPALQHEYGYDPDEAARVMPDLTGPDDLHNLIHLSTVHIFDTTWDGVAYEGFEFDCTWDAEHGLGVLTHRARMVEVGGAEVSYEEWLARRDLDSMNE